MESTPFNRQLLTLFADELAERCAEAEELLLELEAGPEEKRRPEVILGLFRLCHSMKGAASFVGVRPIEVSCHWLEDIFEAAREGTAFPQAFFGRALKILDAVAETGRMILRGEDYSGGPLSVFVDSSGQVDFPDKDEGGKDIPVPPLRTTETDGSVRVPSGKLDNLLYRSEEFLITRMRLRARTEEVAEMREAMRQFRIRNEPGVSVIKLDDVERFEGRIRRLAANLDDDLRLLEDAANMLEVEVRGARMQPFSAVCSGLHRVVRDLGLALGKQARLIVEGEDTQVDRSILGGLHDAVRHLVRNAMDHGIELPDLRRASGKAPTGTIRISASVQGDRIKVTVGDDGAGMDVAKLRARAEELGLKIGDEDRDAYLTVFNPGFSTAGEVTEVSGRGIGLDIVKDAVEKLRGFIDVTSQPGQGTTFTLALPLSLTSTRALLVTAGKKKFAIEAAGIRRIVDFNPKMVEVRSTRSFYVEDGNRMPFLDLTQWMRLLGREKGDGFGIILGTAENETFLRVESIIGDQEILVRPLGPRLAGMRSYDGGTILPDGEIVLAINIASLLEAAVDPSQSPRKKVRRRRKRILVADDSSSTRAVQKILLEEDGYEVVLAGDGTEAWDLLRNHGADAVVADIDMPGLDGFALTEHIRKSERFRRLPVILVSSRANEADIGRGRRAGADAYLTKSTFEHRILVEELKKLL